MTASPVRQPPSPAQHSLDTTAHRAASIQAQIDRQELHCSVIALIAKCGLIVLGCVSVARLAVAYQERLERHGEIAAVVTVETARMASLQSSFDRLFTIGGEKRLMGDQDQWIAPDRLRVIWR